MAHARLARLALALLALLPLPALAAPASATSVATVNLFSPPSLLGLAGLLTRNAAQVAKGKGYAVVSPDESADRLGRDGLQKMARCDLKPSCLASYGANLKAKRLLTGSLDRDDVHYVIHLVLVDLATGALIASAERNVLIASRQLEPQFNQMLPDLLAGKSSVPTRITLTSPQKHVRAQLDDRPLGELPVTVDVSPGRHEVKAEKPDYLPVDRYIEVAGGQTTALNLPLTLLPNHVDPDEPPPPVASVPVAAARPEVHVEASSGGVPTATWVALGVGVAAAGVGTYFAIKEHGIANRTVDANGDGAYDVTRADALSARRDAQFANIAFITAGAAAVTAGIFYLTRDTSEPAASAAPGTKLGVAPLPGKGGMASLTFDF